jgi:hypothetical protein
MSVESQSGSSYVAIHDGYSNGTFFINLEACLVRPYAKCMPYLSLDSEFSNLPCLHYGYTIIAQNTVARNGVFKSAIRDYYYAF